MATQKPRSPLFVLTCMALWWLIFINVSYFFETKFAPPSAYTYILFCVFVFSFYAGGMIAIPRKRIIDTATIEKKMKLSKPGVGAAILLLILLAYSLDANNAFALSYSDYFSITRGSDADVGFDTLTDSILVFVGFPFFLYILILYESRFSSATAIAFILGFSYLYQVNYPLIYYFWIYLIKNFLFRSIFSTPQNFSATKSLLTVVALPTTIFFAAATRFGDFDILGIFEYYFLSYHILGFSYFDSLLTDGGSFLHKHTFGLLSFGALFQLPSILLNKLGYPDFYIFYDLYSHNISSGRDIGKDSYVEVNAFNTMLGTFYQDFGLTGAILPPFIYGFFTMRNYARSYQSQASRALFIILAFSWLIGFMISPLGRPYFWLCIVGVLISSYAKKISFNYKP